MEQVKTALRSTSAHGLSRTVSNKPIYIRVTWLLIFLCMSALFLKGFVEFVIKLRSNPVTTSIDANIAAFQFPDVYACFENPISGSYSTTMDAKSIEAINAQFNATARTFRDFLNMTKRNDSIQLSSILLLQSMPYHILIDVLAHRIEQSAISSELIYTKKTAILQPEAITAESFIHPLFLRCIRWNLKNEQLMNIAQSSLPTALATVILIDGHFAGSGNSEPSLERQIYAGGIPIPVSDWSLAPEDFYSPDRPAGIRVFLTQPGEYPTEFGTSFSLGPGKQHTVEIDMATKVYKGGHFQCKPRHSDVQFVNPYNQTPYNHSYSFSYCYYYEYHKLFQSKLNVSGERAPLPWPLREGDYCLNMSNGAESLKNVISEIVSIENPESQFARIAKDKCESQRPCNTLDYSVSISSADWPTQSSLAPFVSSSIKEAWTSAKAKNLSVPALDFLLTSSNASTVASYLRNNLLKVRFKPRRVMCDRITFSKDYDMAHFISDVGGIMGIYLGMSLLTLCETFEVVHSLIMVMLQKRRTSAATGNGAAASSISIIYQM